MFIVQEEVLRISTITSFHLKYIPLTYLSFILAWSTFQAHVFTGNIRVREAASQPVVDGNIHLILQLIGFFNLLLFALTLLIFLLGREAYYIHLQSSRHTSSMFLQMGGLQRICQELLPNHSIHTPNTQWRLNSLPDLRLQQLFTLADSLV
ncbi:Hypothetical_protein [Hexamita inflata]|uniref:Hypothetical_protein n=1 Tax=Hexamita inflata TaxID=28002 RepID=A0AA86TZE1_9EUKA|nr:Hypothetical protein HINF_LOCUS21953 [Hexamita inflata]CAI9934314.1 Hypothetical protein HINF_LOCUS21959 [Hexamita inflata]